MSTRIISICKKERYQITCLLVNQLWLEVEEAKVYLRVISRTLLAQEEVAVPKVEVLAFQYLATLTKAVLRRILPLEEIELRVCRLAHRVHLGNTCQLINTAEFQVVLEEETTTAVMA